MAILKRSTFTSDQAGEADPRLEEATRFALLLDSAIWWGHEALRKFYEVLSFRMLTSDLAFSSLDTSDQISLAVYLHIFTAVAAASQSIHHNVSTAICQCQRIIIPLPQSRDETPAGTSHRVTCTPFIDDQSCCGPRPFLISQTVEAFLLLLFALALWCSWNVMLTSPGCSPFSS